ncbi:MAG: hypothetical protein QF510_08370, partial [Rhodospirillales bacterium]|nr:hypothetical protein [Rhodospirillales bacterium]
MTLATRLDPTILREYDIRGIIGENIGETQFRAIGQAFGSQLRAEGGESVAVGYDGPRPNTVFFFLFRQFDGWNPPRGALAISGTPHYSFVRAGG